MATNPPNAPGFTGMRAFTLIWLGQVVSLLGTGITRFAIIFSAYQITGEAMSLAYVTFCSMTPMILLSPVAGALVDRWNRRAVMIMSDLGAGVVTVGLLALTLSGNLETWHFYVAGALAGTFETFQMPAYGAAMTMMLPKEQYARASGMMSMAQSASEIAAPILGGLLLATIGFQGVLILDVVTFVFAIGTLLFVHIPQPKLSEAGEQAGGSLLQESMYGFRYILDHAGLFGLQLIFFINNLMTAIAIVLLPALVLSRTGNNEVALGSVMSALGVGGLVGGLVLTTWGGPKNKKIHGVLLGWTLAMLGQAVFGFGQSVTFWMVAGFLMMLFTPILNGSNQAIWQTKVAPDLQGRVFGARRLIAQVSFPLAALLGGFLADHVFEPGMQPGGPLAQTFGSLVGTGAGSGMSLLFILTGLLGAAASLAAYTWTSVRDVETLLPDHEAIPAEA